MLDITPTPLAAAVAPRTGKIIKNGFRIIERGENLQQMVYYTLRIHSVNREKLRWKVKSLYRRKTDFSERGSAHKGLSVESFLFMVSAGYKKLT